MRSANTRLRVTMSDGEIIECSKAADTVEKVIFKLGPEKVLEKDYENMLISRHQLSQSSRQFTEKNGYYISRDFNTEKKKWLLERIAERLGVLIRIKIIR